MVDVQRAMADAFRAQALKAQRHAARAAELARIAVDQWEREERFARDTPQERRRG